MRSIKISLAKKIDNSYEIVIGDSLLPSINSFIKNKGYDHSAIITDNNLHRIFVKHLKKINGNEILVFRSGEKYKNVETYKELCLKLFGFGFSRKSVIIAFGGGIVGDMAGQIAASYMRGVDYIQIPTTLLAMVDSSIGGKVGFDLNNGKNIIGSFYQPKKVFIDVSYLDKLPRGEFLNGVAEIIKYSIIKDRSLFKSLADSKNNWLFKDKRFLTEVIRTCCEIKKSIVENDEKEHNLRKILNFGHTWGHAIEAYSGYKIPHGQAIAIGMCLESLISNKLNFLPEDDLNKIIELIKGYGLPTSIDGYNSDKLLELMKKDKKSDHKKLVFALPERIGLMKSINGCYGITVEDSIVKEIIEMK